MTKELAQATRNHKEWISHPDWWPIFGICPVTRRAENIPSGQQTQHQRNQDWEMSLGFGKQTGVIVSVDLLEVRIGILGFTNFSNAPTIKYASLDDLLADGWIVD